jgi:DNA-binding Lrp family transcriptional regulator
MKPLDSLDQKLLNLLSQNARTPVAVLASKLQVARTTINNRLARLEKEKTIQSYTIKRGTRDKQGLTATVLVQISQEDAAGVLSHLKKIPLITKVITVSGRSDLMLTVCALNTEDLDQVLDDIGRVTGVIRSETFIQLSTKLDRSGV